MIGHYLEVAQATGCFIIKCNFGDYNINA